MIQKHQHRQAKSAVTKPVKKFKQLMSFESTVQLVAGGNEILLDMPSMKVKKITIQSACEVTIIGIFYGSRNIFKLEDRAVGLPDGSIVVTLESANQFYEGIPTTIGAHSDRAGELSIKFEDEVQK